MINIENKNIKIIERKMNEEILENSVNIEVFYKIINKINNIYNEQKKYFIDKLTKDLSSCHNFYKIEDIVYDDILHERNMLYINIYFQNYSKNLYSVKYYINPRTKIIYDIKSESYLYDEKIITLISKTIDEMCEYYSCVKNIKEELYISYVDDVKIRFYKNIIIFEFYDNSRFEYYFEDNQWKSRSNSNNIDFINYFIENKKKIFEKIYIPLNVLDRYKNIEIYHIYFQEYVKVIINNFYHKNKPQENLLIQIFKKIRLF